MRVLYVSYDGMTDPLGRSQVLPYLVGLSECGHRFDLVSSEKPEPFARGAERVREICNAASIRWAPLRYHKNPPMISTVWDVAALKRRALARQREAAFDLVHCRSYVAALVGLAMKRRFGTPFLFDMRGFWPEEKLHGWGWDRDPLHRAAFRYFKAREREFFREADAIVSLTEAGRGQMMDRPAGERPVVEPVVIPCCVDFAHFELPRAGDRMEARGALGIPADASVLAYLGSLGGSYLLDEMLQFFAALRQRRPGARFLFVTRDSEEWIRTTAGKYAIGRDELLVVAADRDEVPRLLAAADWGIAFKRAGFAELACSPTKLGEMLAMGIPVVANSGVGDVDRIITDTGGGVIVERFDRESLFAAIDTLLGMATSAAEIRSGGERWFQLRQGVEAYDALYRSLERRSH